MSFGRIAALALVAATVVSGFAVTPTRAATVSLPPAADCVYATTLTIKAEADRIMARHLELGTHADWILPKDPTWREQPFDRDQNWLFNYHALRWVLALLQAGRETGTAAYTDRAAFLLKDWLASNPRSSRATLMSWNDMTAGMRASVLACATRDLGRPAWLLAGIRSHGTALADPAFYADHGNHALNQVIGLVDVACVLPLASWKTLAVKRMTALVVESIDAEGASNEQSIGYQLYNYAQYERARRHLVACGLAVPSAFTRVARMPEFLAHATAPDGKYVQLGDTDLQAAKAIDGTAAEFAATAGTTGPRPTTTIRRYAAGYLFARTGWGDVRPFASETHLTMRFGPGVAFHGHPDGQSLTLSARGRRLLVDPGKYTYTAGPWKAYFESRAAHSVVVVDGLRYDLSRATAIATITRPEFLYATATNSGYAGVSNRRRVVWSRAADYLIVDDALAAPVMRTYRQTWHLARGSVPTISGSRLDTNFGSGNLAIVQLVGRPDLRVITGATNPIQGWVSEKYQTKFTAPVLQTTIKAKSARYLTLLVPYGGTRPIIRGRVVSLTSTGFVVDVTIGSRTERVTVAGSTVSVVPG